VNHSVTTYSEYNSFRLVVLYLFEARPALRDEATNRGLALEVGGFAPCATLFVAQRLCGAVNASLLLCELPISLLMVKTRLSLLFFDLCSYS
tara:strand:+ start:108 stop:383 length:276 start_codon:yes stop_codon:yes gene_type:complete